MALSDKEKQNLGIKVGKIFCPSAPIDEQALFAGRTAQIRKVIDAVTQRGLHAILFGERGVGKTSLANVISEFLESAGELVLAPQINCDVSDDFSSLWRKIFIRIQVSSKSKKTGFSQETETQTENLVETLPEEIMPDDVQRALQALGGSTILITVIDEFDRLENIDARRLFADTIKTLSDHSVPCTLLLVGVADTVDELISEHESIERALIQIRVPRMSQEELHEIIRTCLPKVGMDIDEDALKRVSLLSQGLPHYTHALGLHAARSAIDNGTLQIEISHVETAIVRALDEAQQSTKSAYHKATASPRKENLYKHVLLACALAKTDELGYFAAADVRGPMTEIMRKTYDIPSFVRHLTDFSEKVRGEILDKSGEPRRFRFRFKHPLMQPYVIMQGLVSGLIDNDQLESLGANGL